MLKGCQLSRTYQLFQRFQPLQHCQPNSTNARKGKNITLMQATKKAGPAVTPIPPSKRKL